MIVSLAQMMVRPAKITENLQSMREYIDRARSAGAQMVVFPELCLGGYLLADRWTSRAFCDELLACDAELQERSKDLILIYGNVWLSPAGKNHDGRVRKLNAARVFADGQPIERAASPMPAGVTAKTLHPNYRVFDDSRYFFSLLELATAEGRSLADYHRPFVVPKGRCGLAEDFSFGVQICEDLWFDDYQYGGKPLNVTALQIAGGAQLIVNISASPWTWAKGQARHRRVERALAESPRRVPFAYVNCVGVQNNGKNFVTFDGDSAVYATDGHAWLQANAAHEAELLVFRLDHGQISPIDRSDLVPRQISIDPGDMKSGSATVDQIPPAKSATQFLAAIAGIRAVDDIIGPDFPWIIGLSGGIDSAVCLGLLVQAVGPARVRAFNLPSRYNSSTTIAIAAELAAACEVKLGSLPIEELVQANKKLLLDFDPSEFNLENIQAKIRGTSLLSNIAAILGGVMINCGNKVEIALGYGTLYGDIIGALAPLGDLLKTEVFALGQYLNEAVFKHGLIPARLFPTPDFEFAIPPSAELRPDQRDPMKWGYHDALLQLVCTYDNQAPEDILELWLKGNLWSELQLPISLVRRYHLDVPEIFVADLEWFFSNFYRSVFKRIQSPPIIIMSRSAFGYDFRESQVPWQKSRRYLAVRKEILGQA